MIGLHHYLVFGAGLFFIGLYGVLTRRNAIGILMSIELMFNAANVNLAAFSRYVDPHLYAKSTLFHGQIFVIFVIVLAAAEAVVGLALVLSIYRHIKTLYVEHMNILRG